MRRIVAIAVLAVAVLAVLVVGTGARSDGGAYKVRAIFDNAGFLVPGEDVKVSGVVIGAIDSLDVTPDKKAVVVLNITDPAFRSFKADARCQVRLQSLIGEKFVACTPTQPKSAEADPAPPLRKLESGPGKGQYLLPLENTSSPVDLDMLNNVMELPERQRFAVILNEFGTGLAGNGEHLRAAIRRAFPALDEFDRLVKILAEENRMIARLAEDGDRALVPLARETEAIGAFIEKAGQTATATAEVGDALERNFERFPQLLDELEPTMAELERFSLAAAPVFADLRAAAPYVNQLFEQLGPFSTAALPTMHTLGDAAEVSRRALLAARPVIKDISGLARATGPLARDLALGLSDLERQRGIDRFMRTVLGFTGALNGYDAVGHYLRTFLVLEMTCMNVATEPSESCSVAFSQRQAIEESDMEAGAASDTISLPELALPAPEPAAERAAGDAVADGGGDAAAAASESVADDPRTGVLGYLLGSEAVR